MDGAQPISVGDIRHYLDMVEERDVSERLKVIRMVQAIDSIYLAHVVSKPQAAAKK